MAIMSVGQIPAYWAARDPNAPALTHEGRTVTRAEFDARTNRLARAYQEAGVGEGDLVTIGLPNGIEFFEACFATWKLGATPQPVSSRLPKAERDMIVEVGQPTLVVGAEPGMHGGTPCLPIGFEPDESLSDAALPEITARYWKAPTSGGSTGRPKIIVSGMPGAFDPDEALYHQQIGRAQLVPGPLYHNGPFSFSMLGFMTGNHIVIMSRFDAEETLRLLAEHKIDWVMLVPTMMHRIWNLPEDVRNKYNLSHLRVALHLAAPCPTWLKEKWIEWLGASRIHELYAGTEAQGGTWITGEEWLEHRGSVGKPNAGCEMKIVGKNGETLPPGEVGEVFMRPLSGPGTTYHYIGADPKQIEGGWESIGDVGYMDEDGYLYLADRHTDMILCGGANIYPAEVEAAIDSFPGVRSSAVIGLPHDDLGNVVHAIIDAPGGFDEGALKEYLAERLVRYKIPRSFEVAHEPLRDDAGKLRRSALRAERIKAPAS
ncbi:AMP-binding protein [Parvibaculum sedimenti]|uniref:AMP-binding protein n=1 Tax=Parvibaculum sedimenti TaxID=2608632 RepID=A0A6N6VIE8_9HYPH|nr:AMP-binding protein [Parvibaculum sedimenti]KAB7738641.1 AMP-binding protein [Parvibaculum sedimenti]